MIGERVAIFNMVIGWYMISLAFLGLCSFCLSFWKKRDWLSAFGDAANVVCGALVIGGLVFFACIYVLTAINLITRH